VICCDADADWQLITSPAGAVAKYCDEYVMSVCLSVCQDISGTAHVIFTSLPIFCACCLWPWLGPLPAEGAGAILEVFLPIDNAL